MGAQAGEGVGVGVGVDAILELDDDDRKETAYATRTVYLPWEHLPLIAIANNTGSLPLLICAILITLLAICTYRTMTVAIVADITPRPLRTKADSVQKMHQKRLEMGIREDEVEKDESPEAGGKERVAE